LPSSPSSHVIAASQTTITVAPSCHVTHRHRRPFLPRHPPPPSPPPVAPTAVTLFCHVTHHRRRMPRRPRYHHHPPRCRPRHRPLLAGRIPRGATSSGVVEGRGGGYPPLEGILFFYSRRYERHARSRLPSLQVFLLLSNSISFLYYYLLHALAAFFFYYHCHATLMSGLHCMYCIINIL
jgi:hypothetical protein